MKGKLLKFLLLASLFSLLMLTTPALAAPTTITIYSSTSDAYLYAWNLGGGYTVVHNYPELDGENGEVPDDPYNLYVGQDYWVVAHYDIYRAVLYFDTSVIPDNAIINSVTFKFTTAGVWGSGYSLEVVNGAGIAEPLTGVAYGTLLGRTISGASVENLESETAYEAAFNSNGIGWINKSGATILGLRTDKDIDTTTPSGSEYFCMEPREWEKYGGLEEVPQLEISYTVPPAGITFAQSVIPVIAVLVLIVLGVAALVTGLTLAGLIALAIGIIMGVSFLLPIVSSLTGL